MDFLLADDVNFSFYCKPYLLKLRLPGECVDDTVTPAKATYDPDESKGTITITFRKKVQNEDFRDIDMITKLMQPHAVKNTSSSSSSSQKIIEIESTTFVSGREDKEEEESNKNHTTPTTLPTPILPITTHGYGFNSRHTHILSKNIGMEFPQLTKFDTAPSEISHETRRSRRILEENEHFDEDRYMCDFVDIENNDHTVQHALKMKSPCHVSKLKKDDDETLRRLARHPKPLISSMIETRRVMSTLCDILFAYAYDRRLTDDEFTVESGWNIWNLSPSLCWLDRFDSPQDALSACLHRSLVFPYARLWKLSMCCIQDVQNLVSHGRRTILNILLRVRNIFKLDEQRYLLNRMFLDDYVVWIQYVDEKMLKSLSEELRVLSFTKKSIRWDLKCLEDFVLDAVREYEEVDEESGTEEEEEVESSSEEATSSEEEEDKEQNSTIRTSMQSLHISPSSSSSSTNNTTTTTTTKPPLIQVIESADNE
jgi:protein SHQ1